MYRRERDINIPNKLITVIGECMFVLAEGGGALK
jgi:hypothetical protein